MKRVFTASIVREENWHVAQYLDVDVASQGETETEAIANLHEAIELHFEPPVATIRPLPRPIENGNGTGWTPAGSGGQVQR